VADCFVSCYPNAGLPNPMSDTGYDETPAETSRLVREFAQSGFVNIIGGCLRHHARAHPRDRGRRARASRRGCGQWIGPRRLPRELSASVDT